MDLEDEKHNLQSDVDMKKEAVAQSSGEIKRLRCDIEISEKELDVLRNSLQCKEKQFRDEVKKLSTELDNEKFVKLNMKGKRGSRRSKRRTRRRRRRRKITWRID